MTDVREGFDVERLLVHNAWLQRLARHLLRDSAAADDVVQDTWIATMRNPPDPSRPALPWLAEVVRNLVRSRSRESARRARREQVASDDGQTADADVVERAQLHRQLVQCVLELEEPYRRALLMRFIDDLEPTEIAKRLGVPAGTVRRRLHEGLRRLRLRLGTDEQDRLREHVRRGLLIVTGGGHAQPQPPLALFAMSAATTRAAAAALATLAILLTGWHLLRGPGAPQPPAGATGFATTDRRTRPAFVYEEAPPVAAGVLEGIVRAPDGTGYDGATVTALRSRNKDAPGADWTKSVAVATTAAGGRFRFTDLVPGEYAVTATGGAYAPADEGPVLVEPSSRAQIELRLGPDGVALSGRVLDMGGGTVPGATVTAVAFGGGGSAITRMYQVRATERGTYAVSLARGSYWLVAAAARYATTNQTAALNGATTVDLTLEPAARIAGRVLERATRTPVADAEVVLVVSSGAAFQAKSDEAGRFELDEVRAGNYRVSARKAGLTGLTPLISVTVTGAAEGVEVLLDPGRPIEGRVTTDDGAPVADARVFAHKLDPPAERPGFVRTVADGSFRVEGLFAGAYRLEATSDAHAPHRSRVDLTKADARGLRVKLAAASAVEGVVRDAQGAAIPGVVVGATVVPAGPGAFSFGAPPARTDQSGRFVLTPLGAGKLFVFAEDPRTRSRAELRDQTLGAAERKRIELKLEPGPSLRGRVTYEGGGPAAGAVVHVTGGGTFLSATTKADGAFELDGAPTGEVLVRAFRRSPAEPSFGPTNDRSTRVLHLSAGGHSDVELVLSRGGKTIAGVVVDDRGRPVAGVIVNGRAEIATGQPAGLATGPRQFTGEDGRFRFDDVDEGPHRLWLFHPDFGPGEEKGIVAGSDSLKLVLHRAATTSGVVVDKAGNPLPDFLIVAMHEPSWLTPELRKERLAPERFGLQPQRFHDPSGTFHLNRLKTGSYELRANTVDGLSGMTRIVLAAGEHKQGVRIVIDVGVRITGRVIEHEGGAPIARAEVRLNAPGRSLTTTTDDDGHFELSGVAVGEEITVASTGNLGVHVTDSRVLTVPAAATSAYDIPPLRLLRGDERARFEMPALAAIGTTFRWQDGRVVVATVAPGSPAQQQGVTPGDSLTTVDGKDVGGLGPGGLSWLLSGAPGTPVAVGIEAAGQPRMLTLTRVK